MKVLIFTMPDGSIAYTNGGSFQTGGQVLKPVAEVEMGEQEALDLFHHPTDHTAQKDKNGSWSIQRKDSSQKGKPA